MCKTSGLAVLQHREVVDIYCKTSGWWVPLTVFGGRRSNPGKRPSKTTGQRVIQNTIQTDEAVSRPSLVLAGSVPVGYGN